MADICEGQFMAAERRKTSTSEALCGDALQATFNHLSFVDIARARSVCSSWNSVIKSLIKSSCYTESHQLPWLLLPSPDEEEDEVLKTTFRLYNLEENRVHNVHQNTAKEIAEFCCIVSSHGCLLFLDKNLAPFILNPLTSARIRLPRINRLLGIIGITIRKEDQYVVLFRQLIGCRYSTKTGLRDLIINKPILSSDPFHSNNSKVVILYFELGNSSKSSKLAFCEIGGSSWTRLEGKFRHYSDIICYGNLLYALGKSCSVECWDLSNDNGSSSPTKLMEIEAGCPMEVTKTVRLLEEIRPYDHSFRTYLVSSSGKILLAARYSSDYVEDEDDLFSPDSNQPLVYPYETMSFKVFELDIEGKRWVKMETLEDCALFLGGNHSVAVSGKCGRNCVYFSDDNWERMDEDYSYGGHDLGVFCLDDGKVRKIDEVDCSDGWSIKIQPSPCWILPTPW